MKRLTMILIVMPVALALALPLAQPAQAGDTQSSNVNPVVMVHLRRDIQPQPAIAPVTGSESNRWGSDLQAQGGDLAYWPGADDAWGSPDQLDVAPDYPGYYEYYYPGYDAPAYGNPGYPDMGPRYSGQWPYYAQPSQPLGRGDARGIIEGYLRTTRNPNLRLARLIEKDTYFEGLIMDGNWVVDTILVNKYTGWMGFASQLPTSSGNGPLFGPAMPMGVGQAVGILDEYLRSTQNPNLRIGRITQTGQYFEGDIVTQNNFLVDEVLINKYTGWIRSVFR
jgi:hypothetical protein